MTGRLIEVDLFVKERIIDPRTAEGKDIHAFLMERGRKLAGNHIDFEKNPVTMVLSDKNAPNAFFMGLPDPEDRPSRDDDETVRTVKTPLTTPVISVTRGLIEMVDNIDELDFVLAHELTHMIMRQNKIKRNSKGEEEIGDIHAVDLMYDAGSDPKAALAISGKLHDYIQEQRKIEARRKFRYKRDRYRDHGLNWSAIFDVHMTATNRKAGIEAALTRLSHLIDDRAPTPIKKDVFAPRYTDPVDRFLADHHYDRKKSLGKIKLLIDCIDALAKPQDPEVYFQDQLDQLAAESHYTPHYLILDKAQRIQKEAQEGFPNYYHGPLVEKKYQQKITRLAEQVITDIENERDIRGNPDKPAELNGEHLLVYLVDKAYAHIDRAGLPRHNDKNLLDSSSILYSFFYKFLNAYIPDHRRAEDVEETLGITSLYQDIEDIKKTLLSVATAEDFSKAHHRFQELTDILREISTDHYGEENRGDKFDNLSGLYVSRFYRKPESPELYGRIRGGRVIPWQNLVDIAEQMPAIKDEIIALLKNQNIKDFRLTHGKDFVRVGHNKSYRVEKEKTPSHPRLSRNKIADEELDFAVHQELVLEVYDYIKNYFESEQNLVEDISRNALTISEQDFKEFDDLTDRYNRKSTAHQKHYEFVSLFNSLTPPDSRHYGEDGANDALQLISERYQNSHPLPGAKKVHSGLKEITVFPFSRKLLNFNNKTFQEHFGKDAKAGLAAQKETFKDQLFDTAIKLMEKAIAELPEAKRQKKVIDKKHRVLLDAFWKEKEEDIKEAKKKEADAAQDELAFRREAVEHRESVIYNFLRSIFKGDERWYQLNRLTEAQKRRLAEFAVYEHPQAIIEQMHYEGYDHFCDYLNILGEQIENIVKGNWQTTPAMTKLADMHNFHVPSRIEELRPFTDNFLAQKYDRDESRYFWHIFAFNLIGHLKISPRTDVYALARALSEIEAEERSCKGSDPHEIISQRRHAYIKLIHGSDIVALAETAIDYQPNYNDLTVKELLDTADQLTIMRSQFADILGLGGFSYRKKAPLTKEHARFLHITDKNIRGLMRKAEHKALLSSDRLDKIMKLFEVYNPKSGKYGSDNKRGHYIPKLADEEGRREALTTLSRDLAFWPDDTFEHVKAYVFAKHTFLDDKELEDIILNRIFDKIESLPRGKKKNECLRVMLDQKMRAAYPETRARLFDLYVDDVSGKLGPDDGSARYQGRLEVYLTDMRHLGTKDWDNGKRHSHDKGLLKNKIAIADRYSLMRRLSDRILSQEASSEKIHEACQVKLSSEKMVKSYLYGVGVDFVTEDMDRTPSSARHLLTFLNSQGEHADCKTISAYIQNRIKEKYKGNREMLEHALKRTSPSYCKILYENFWSAALEPRAIIIARLLKSAVRPDPPASAKGHDFYDYEADEDEAMHDPQAWEQVFDLVMDSLIPEQDQSKEARYARDIMHSYIRARSDYERELIMSAMMVANRNIGQDAGNVGKALRFFLENMGPAEIKLGQAVSSHPQTPDAIRQELQHLKNAADVPARWTLYEWIRQENIPEDAWKPVRLGEILGSASYYTTVALGEDHVLRLLRPEAREKAAKGFRVIKEMIADLRRKDKDSPLDYRDLTDAVAEMVTQAAHMSSVETDHDLGRQQYETAKALYNGKKISAGPDTFHLQVMDWRHTGRNWIIMDKARGRIFNQLPATTPQERRIKTNFAKAYIALELSHILSGQRFDHDRHGAQLALDPQTNQIGIFDTGAMALEDPAPEEQHALGRALYRALKAARQTLDLLPSLNQAIDTEIIDTKEKGQSGQYLVEVKKGVLALGDFFACLSAHEIKDHLQSHVMLNAPLCEHILKGFTEKMSLLEKAQVKALLATRPHAPSKGKKPLKQCASPAQNKVILSDAQASKRLKATWLQTLIDVEVQSEREKAQKAKTWEIRVF